MVFEKSLTAMVKGIRAHRGKEPEYINTCLQEIRNELVSKNVNTKSTAVLKLSYLNMMGYDMGWASFGIVEVMSNGRFAVRRPGYLAAAMSFTDTTDVALLTTNLFKKDFGSQSQHEAGLALNCLSSICTPEISRDIIQDLTSLLASSRSYLRKKVVLCLYRIFLKDPPALRTCFPKLKERLGDEDQGVLTATVNTFLELSRKNAKNYLSLVPQLYHILTNTTNNWLSIKLLKVFQLLCPLEPRLPAKMVEPLTNFLNTTKALSVEFESIRCTVRVMPEGTALMAIAMEKLQNFLNSSDRNLRFLALDLYREILDQPQFKDKLVVPNLQEKVLESMQESDTTARTVALQLLDRIVTPATFMDMVKKLMEFSKSASSPDEFVGTILRMGCRDRYALVEDFALYLLILADIARNSDSGHSTVVAEQFVDIVVRVPQVRPCGLAVALSLLDGGTSSETEGGRGTEGAFGCAMSVVGASAWVLGEFHEAVEGPVEATLLRAAKLLVTGKYVRTCDPLVQVQCIWAATKFYMGAPKLASGIVQELHDLLAAQLPSFVSSTHVEVSERANLALQLVSFAKADAEKMSTAGPLFKDPLLPVASDAQQQLPIPVGLNLDEPFYEPEEVAPQQVFSQNRADPADPYQLASNYKDDLGFLAAREKVEATPDPVKAPATSMFYLSSKDQSSTAAGSDETPATSADAPADPLAQMRERLEAQRAGGGVKYQVMREDVQAPRAVGGTPAASAPASAPSMLALPPLVEKELSDLQGRLWSVCFKDAHVSVYACIRAKNAKKNLLRLELRCEKLNQDSAASVSNVMLHFPEYAGAQEVDDAGFVTIVLGFLMDKSPKARVNLKLDAFGEPLAHFLSCELKYDLGEMEGEEGQTTDVRGKVDLRLPASTFLTVAPTSEDEIATYMSEHPELNTQQSGQAVSLSSPGKEAATLAAELPAIVRKCVSLCNFHGIQQGGGSAQGKGQKFLLVARPQVSATEAQTLPSGSLVICLCACLARDDTLDMRLTVKCCRKNVCDDVCAQLADTFRELVEGRLR